MTIGISELQKNMSIFKNLSQTVQVIDKKTKKVLAIILPRQEIEKRSLTESLGGILSSHKSIDHYQDINQDINGMIDDAYAAEMREKYGK